MMQVVFRPEAESELFKAQEWYEACAPGLGYEFARAAEVAVELAIRMTVLSGCVPISFTAEGERETVLSLKVAF